MCMSSEFTNSYVMLASYVKFTSTPIVVFLISENQNVDWTIAALVTSCIIHQYLPLMQGSV